LEAKRLLSAGASAGLKAGPRPPAESQATHEAIAGVAEGQAAPDRGVSTQGTVSAAAVKPETGFLVYRITNPNLFNNKLIPPFTNVLVQTRQPVPGQVYNVLFMSLRNGTAQTFDASSGFSVRFPGQAGFIPILTGDQQWKPGQVFVFYVLTKKYYPLPNVVTSGFLFYLGAKSVAIPGPSGIFLRLTYNPATFDRTLDRIVAFGQGAQGGAGTKLGLPNTSIYEFVSAKTNRIDFGGYF
jgi:hypothetical protein